MGTIINKESAEVLKNNLIKIIIVDDNLLFRNILKRVLEEEYSYNVEVASGGEEFFSIPNYASADIILMDLQMPVMDGFAITKKLIAENNNIRIIAITMFTEKAFLQELILTGFKGCVFKPQIYRYINKAITQVMSGEFYFPVIYNM